MRVNSKRNGQALRLFALALLLLLSFIISPTPVTQAQPDISKRATVTIHADRVVGKISPLLYGQFLEFMFEGIKGGLYAELIRNRSFEEPANAIGLSRDWERYPDNRNDDYGINFLWDDSIAYPTQQEANARQHSLRVDVAGGVIPRHGVYQSGIPVRGGVGYWGYLWAKTLETTETTGAMSTAGYRGRISVSLEAEVPGEQPYAETDLAAVSGDWKKYEFRLRTQKTDPLARLAILFFGSGRLWVDQVSLIPEDAVDGVRRDVFDRVKALHPAFIRWPGGNVAQDYHWMWGTGPRDERVTWINLSWKNEPEPSDFGTDEFVRFSHNVGAEPSLTVNVEGRGATAEEAAAWVEYCNGPGTSKYGSLRAKNGHAEPYRVKYWEVGNEIWGDWVRGHSDAETYARNFNRYASAMRSVDPAIKLIAVGDNDMKWNRTVLSAGQNIDYLAIHHYYGRREMAGDTLNLMARPLFYERFYSTVQNLISEVVPQRPIKLAINEWGLDLPISQQYSMMSALYGARLLNVFERAGDVVELSAVSDLLNGWPGGIIQAGRHGLFVSPLYLVNQIYSEHLGAERLSTEVQSPTFDSSREGKQIPVLDASVSRSADGRWMFIKLVNVARDERLMTTFKILGAKVAPSGEIDVVSSANADSSNSFATPNAVSLARTRIPVNNEFSIALSGASVSVITLRIIA
jgi:alpha-N-arabinofuranosidase